ncbi:uncharacterized protein LOC127750760 [Frankliniella occidentalis]|uniref:Uncharacterized protein LOC127750760 n=1 Tax=Frankliniella occidentalis TaxID=133901 RepID=A0A9C6X4V3_FRAOC|nr:uncharacterized protein LOC127750760 [Frankliniella occidentalis]
MLKTKVLHTLANANDNDAEINDIEAMFRVLENPFAEIANEAQRITALKNAGAYIGSTEYLIGSSLKEVRVNSIMIPQVVPSYGQFISMSRSLQSFLELPDVLDKIMLNIANLSEENNVISNFIQGSLRKHLSEPFVAEGKIVIPLFFYLDDYEPNNGLGSHALDEKTNGLYYKIPCIPSEFLSLLRVKCVIQQLKDLEENGILIELPDRTVRIYFLLGLILGDNLGLNGILGFVECFTANFCCRMTFAVDNYRLTGLKEDCAFNALQAFHATVNIAGDVLHDVEEGLCAYALPRILFWLIHIRKYLSYETFLDRNLGQMIGDFIPGNEEVWLYYLCLLELLQMVLAPSFRIEAEML